MTRALVYDMTTRLIWCCGCGEEVEARLTDGREIYPRRAEVRDQPFWVCDRCGNSVGCHHKTADRTKPLGCIATPALKNARGHIHRILDPMWVKGGGDKKKRRRLVYQMLANKLGIAEYHTAEIRTIEEARTVYRAVLEIRGSRP